MRAGAEVIIVLRRGVEGEAVGNRRDVNWRRRGGQGTWTAGYGKLLRTHVAEEILSAYVEDKPVVVGLRHVDGGSVVGGIHRFARVRHLCSFTKPNVCGALGGFVN